MLALEIPVVVNAGVGDVDEIVEETGGGVVVDRFDDRSYRRALDQLTAARPDMKRWRAAARVHFDLETGIDRYDAVYRNLVRTAVGSGKPVR